MRPGLAPLLAGLAAALAPSPASAHLVGVEFGDFYAGALHLASAPEHVAVLAALGLAAARQPRERARWMLLALPLGLGAGVAVAWGTGATLLLDPMVGASLAVAGLIGVAALRLPMWTLALLAALIGAVHGFANGDAGREAPIDWPLYAGGVTTAGAVIGSLLIAIATALVNWRSWTPLAGRVVASWLAAVGIIFLGLSLAA
ncbi:MAG: HupE/UreJ family protein [Caulobacterales bacterium]|nr:HupE/UreJ family protein [Caulobacterales bacterium]